jgi:hypothetical protein
MLLNEKDLEGINHGLNKVLPYTLSAEIEENHGNPHVSQ